jgi:site-specific DNA-methyltransferase (adenine-specific)
MQILSLKGKTKVPIKGKGGAEYDLVHEDCFRWMRDRPEAAVEAIVTDPPFGLVEYSDEQLKKLHAGRGGVWRIPPELGGVQRKPLPRFTVLREHEVGSLVTFFELWGREALRILVPGGHVIIAGNPLFAPLVASALMAVGFERRGEVIRLVRTLRGGDRPKLAEQEYAGVSVMARSCYEPWGVFRKPLRERTVAENLRRWRTGGLRRTPDGRPFPDVLKSETPPANEEAVATHPSLKPQRFMRQIVWAALPLGEGVVLDPFMGSGSTVSAAVAVGYKAIGVEKQRDFFELAKSAVPKLAVLDVDWESFETYNGASGRA